MFYFVLIDYLEKCEVQLSVLKYCASNMRIVN